jgi:hypothetical protein
MFFEIYQYYLPLLFDDIALDIVVLLLRTDAKIVITLCSVLGSLNKIRS